MLLWKFARSRIAVSLGDIERGFGRAPGHRGHHQFRVEPRYAFLAKVYRPGQRDWFNPRFGSNFAIAIGPRGIRCQERNGTRAGK